VSSAPKPPTPAPLDYATMEQMAKAQGPYRRLRRAASVAAGDGWTIVIFGGLSLLCTLAFGFSLNGFLLGTALVVMGVVEIKGGKALLKLDPTAPRRLCWNQIFLASALTVYAIWNLLATLGGHTSELAREIASLDAGMANDIEHMYVVITRLMYVCLIVVSVLAQGGLAFYYHRREKMLADYLATTPPFILEMQRAGLGV